MSEVEVKAFRDRIDEMKKLILKYGVYPTMMYAIKKGQDETGVFILAFSELQKEGKIPP